MSSPIDFNVHGTRSVKCPFGRLYKFFFHLRNNKPTKPSNCKDHLKFLSSAQLLGRNVAKTVQNIVLLPNESFHSVTIPPDPSYPMTPLCSTTRRAFIALLWFIAASCPIGYSVNWSRCERPSLSLVGLWVLFSTWINIKFDRILLSAQVSLNWGFEQRNVMSYPSPLPFSLLTGLSIKTFCAEVNLCGCNKEHTLDTNQPWSNSTQSSTVTLDN